MLFSDLNLDSVTEWQKCDDTLEHSSFEEANVVLFPKSRHEEEKSIQAKRAELQKLKDFHVYEEVPDRGQHCISTRWVLRAKGEQVKA